MEKGELPQFDEGLSAGTEWDIPVSITRIVDEAFPIFVECVFTDVAAKQHYFHVKLPVISEAHFSRNEELPAPARLRCTIVAIIVDADSGERQAIVDTSRPWGEESTELRSEFIVFEKQLESISTAVADRKLN